MVVVCMRLVVSALACACDCLHALYLSCACLASAVELSVVPRGHCAEHQLHAAVARCKRKLSELLSVKGHCYSQALPRRVRHVPRPLKGELHRFAGSEKGAIAWCREPHACRFSCRRVCVLSLSETGETNEEAKVTRGGMLASPHALRALRKTPSQGNSLLDCQEFFVSKIRLCKKTLTQGKWVLVSEMLARAREGKSSRTKCTKGFSSGRAVLVERARRTCTEVDDYGGRSWRLEDAKTCTPSAHRWAVGGGRGGSHGQPGATCL
jgi:hypothetical protein